VGRIGLISMAMTLAGSVVLTLAVSLEAPSMDAEILPILPMVVAVAWAAVAVRRVGADSTTDRRRLSGLGG
jgi:H+/Cl- antiporter ClcA